MKIFILSIFLSLTLFGQSRSTVSLEDKALLERLMSDKSFTVIERKSAEWLSTINKPKQEVYKAYLTKSPGNVQVFIRQSAGREGQYALVWCTVANGKVTIVEAYFGDPSGSGELRRVRQYQPEEMMLGYFTNGRQCSALPFASVPSTAELCIAYKVPQDSTWKRF